MNLLTCLGLSTWIGLAGTRILIGAKRQELEKRFAASYLERVFRECEAGICRLGEKEIRARAAEWEPAGEGGILAALWNLPEAYRAGTEFSLRRIPLRQGTIEICEYFGLNPYRLYSAGCWLLVSENGGRLVSHLAGQGICAGVVGSVTEGIARVVINGGERGFLNRPQPDELEQVVPDWKKEAMNYEREDFGSDRKEQQDRYPGSGNSAGGE